MVATTVCSEAKRLYSSFQEMAGFCRRKAVKRGLQIVSSCSTLTNTYRMASI